MWYLKIQNSLNQYSKKMFFIIHLLSHNSNSYKYRSSFTSSLSFNFTCNEMEWKRVNMKLGPNIEMILYLLGFKAYKELEKVYKDPLLKTDIRKTSPTEKTLGLETYKYALLLCTDRSKTKQYWCIHYSTSVNYLKFHPILMKTYNLTDSKKIKMTIWFIVLNYLTEGNVQKLLKKLKSNKPSATGAS